MAQKKFNVLISDNIAQEGIDLLKDAGIEVTINTNLSHEELKSEIPKYDGIIVRSGTKMTADVISVAENLKVIARAGAGYNNIDVGACSERGIVVMITPTGNTIAVVELTMGLMLTWARNISQANSCLKENKWEKSKYKGTELFQKTLGIVGLGRIGQGVAKRAQAFNMNVVAYDKFVPKSRAKELNVKLYDNLNDMLKEVDYLTLHVPLNESTRNLIDKEQFELMRPGAVIINAARGGVINEKVLYTALKKEKIGGACIDVYSEEPAKKEKFPFIDLENVVTTPHLGASSKEAQINVATLAADHVIKGLKSNIFIDSVNLPFKL